MRRIAEGFRYARSRAPSCSEPTASTSWPCSSACQMRSFPAFAQQFGGAGVLGLLYAAPRLPARSCATRRAAGRSSVHRHGLGVIVAACVWGVGILLSASRTTSRMALARSRSRARPT